MELNDWLAIIGAFGGLEAVRWGVTFWVNRKTNASPSVTPRLMRYTLSFVTNSLIS